MSVGFQSEDVLWEELGQEGPRNVLRMLLSVVASIFAEEETNIYMNDLAMKVTKVRGLVSLLDWPDVCVCVF